MNLRVRVRSKLDSKDSAVVGIHTGQQRARSPLIHRQPARVRAGHSATMCLFKGVCDKLVEGFARIF